MTKMNRLTGLSVMLAVMALAARAAPAARLNVAVFNFQMKSDTPQWRWLEKGLADRATTDFTRSARIAVVARDEMQVLASKLRWIPEMAADPARMARIRKFLKIEYLVTGVYEVKGQQVRITAQIIRVEDRKEVARKEATGPVKDVLNLQRRLSAEMLGWFSDVPPEKILPHLPVWTASIPASQALYEGLHLYDQGRYAEAWLKFRQAWRSDPQYREAHYWVGRMYYFMARYAHARRAYEKFVYMDRTHPRTGDAIKEYLHTYEHLGTPPKALLRLYSDFARRFPEVMIYNELDVNIPVTTRVWLATRSAQLHQQMGNYPEAVKLASAAMGRLQERLPPGLNAGWAYRIAFQSAITHNQLTGKVLIPPGLASYSHGGSAGHLVRFSPGDRQVTCRFREPVRVIYSPHWKRFIRGVEWFLLLAPDDHVFKKVIVHPIVEGTDGAVGCTLRKDINLHQGPSAIEMVSARGLRFNQLPRSGIFQVGLFLRPNDPQRDPRLRLDGVRIEAELEKVPVHGAVQVSCENTNSYTVMLDGELARKGHGLVGLVPPGEHELEYRAVLPFQSVRRKVTVRAGRITPVSASLPWRKDNPLAAWPTGLLIGRDYPRLNPCLQSGIDTPAIQADAKAIRVFWSHRGDLWRATSTDGRRFSPPAKLPMPVSTGWMEQSPKCFRDESGRLLLAFRSDREGQHQMRVYVCWSRDGVHWSRPAMAVDRTVGSFDLIQDDRGRFVWADLSGKRITVLRSIDAYRWEELAELDLPKEGMDVCILQRRNGMYELFFNEPPLEGRGGGSNRLHNVTLLFCRRSADGRKWGAAERVAYARGAFGLSLSALHSNGRSLLACFPRIGYEHNLPPVFARQRSDGTWQRAVTFGPAAASYAALEHHPRWGYMMAWKYPPGTSLFIDDVAGPYFLRGLSVEACFAQKPTSRPK